MTKEHAWPQWLGQGAEVEPEQTTRVIGFGRMADDAIAEARNRIVRKPGSVLTARIREVCAECNNGWMSRLEEAVKPLLAQLWAPSYPFGRVAMSVNEAATLATWATKTAWVRERVGGPILTATADMRKYVVRNELPPEFTSVWVARHRGNSNFGVYVSQIQATHRDDHWTTNRRRNVLLCTMTFRGLSVLVRTDDGWGVPQMEMPDHVWRHFWPVKETVAWPPVRPASDADVHAAASRFTGWLELPDVPVFHRNLTGWQEIRRN